MRIHLVVILVGAFLLNETSGKVLPDYIPQCKTKEPDFVKCVLNAVEKVKPYLLKGIPEINVPPYDPLALPKLTIDRNLEALRLKASLTKMKAYGGSGFKIKNLKIDLKKLTAELSVTIPKMRVTAGYDVNGRLLLIPLAGKGTLEGNFTDCTAFAKGSAKVVEKNNVKYLHIDKFSSKMRIGGGHVKFMDDGANRLIAETAAAFFNANPRLVLDIINPIIEDTSNSIFISMINKIFGSIPYEEVLPEE